MPQASPAPPLLEQRRAERARHARSTMQRLRTAFLPRVRAFHRYRSTPTALLHLGLHVGLAALAAWACERAWQAHPLAGACALLPVLFFIGSRFRALGNMVHECSHKSLVRSPRHNLLLGHLLSFFDFTDFSAYTREHLSHHRHLGHPTLDLDYAARRDFFTRPGRFARLHLLQPLSLFHVPRYLQPVLWSRADSPGVACARLLFNLGLLALALLVGWRAFLLYYLLPYATTYQVFRYWSDAVDHAGLMSAADEFERSRNHVTHPLLAALLFPRSDQYHLVHHLFPVVPTWHLAAVHRLLLEEPAYAAREHQLSSLFTLRLPPAET